VIAAPRRLTPEEIDAFAESIGTRSVIDVLLSPISRWAEVVSTVYGWMLVIAACVMLLRAIHQRDPAHLWSEGGLPIVIGAAAIWWVIRWVVRWSR
jgi:hypothetical protein